MPKNLGLYNDNLSTPRKKDVDACYGPNNAPPYPVTSVNGQTGDVTIGVGGADIGVDIIVQSSQPTNQKSGDFWYQVT